MTEKELIKNLSNREWRLNSLYWIKNEAGESVLFKMNWAQKFLFDNLWYLNVILKVRQLGITTFFCILYLDDVLFNGYDAGLIAHNREDAEKIFDSKIRYAWDRLPEVLKAEYKLDADNVRQLKFVRGEQESSIYVGTSLRSQTCQRLHISEMSTIDQKFPEKAEEIKAGALNTVHLGQIITMESTSKGAEGIFHDVCQDAMKIKKMGRELSKLDWRFFFFPWYLHPAYELPEISEPIPQEMEEYFKELERQEKIKISQAKRNWYFKKKSIQKKSMKSEYPSTPEEAFETSIEGGYYGTEMDKVLEQKRICSVPYDPRFPVDTWWDLGTATTRKAATSIIFTQDVGLEIHIIDFYGNTAEGLAHYAKILQNRGYIYNRHNGPHDLAVKEWGSGKTRLETAANLGLQFDLVENIGFSDGIDAAQMIFSKCWFDEKKTGELTKALRAYRRRWDEKLTRYMDIPLKTWAVDPADAFRMLAVGHPEHRVLGHYDPEELELERIKENEMNESDIDPLNPFGL